MTQATDVAALSFEQALKELEGIVARLEQGSVPLEESISIYERGDALIALLYFAATVMFSLLATGAGLFTVRALT